jgi:hypothetical protein
LKNSKHKAKESSAIMKAKTIYVVFTLFIFSLTFSWVKEKIKNKEEGYSIRLPQMMLPAWTKEQLELSYFPYSCQLLLPF